MKTVRMKLTHDIKKSSLKLPYNLLAQSLRIVQAFCLPLAFSKTPNYCSSIS